MHGDRWQKTMTLNAIGYMAQTYRSNRPAALNVLMPDRVRRLVCFANSLTAYVLPRVVAASPKAYLDFGQAHSSGTL